MKNKVYAFARFYEPKKVQDAVKALLSAGFPREQIKVLFPTEAAKRNSLTTPDGKRRLWVGGLAGLLAGAFFGGLIFVLPAFLWDYHYDRLLAVVGMIIFLGAGPVIGILNSLMIWRRQSGDHVIGPDEHGVFVTIEDGEEDKLNRAKAAYERHEFVNA